MEIMLHKGNIYLFGICIVFIESMHVFIFLDIYFFVILFSSFSYKDFIITKVIIANYN